MCTGIDCKKNRRICLTLPNHQNDTGDQGCGSAFVSSGSGSSILGRIRIRIRIQYGSRALMTKNWKKITAEKNYFFYLSLGHYKERSSYTRSLQLSKEAIQIQNMNFYIFFYFCGSFLPFWIRIRIHWPDWIRIQSGSATLLVIRKATVGILDVPHR